MQTHAHQFSMHCPGEVRLASCIFGIPSPFVTVVCILIPSPPDSVGEDMFSGFPSAAFVCSDRYCYLDYLRNGLSYLDETYWQYSLTSTDDLIRFWRSTIEVTAGHPGGEGTYVDAGALKSIKRLPVLFTVANNPKITPSPGGPGPPSKHGLLEPTRVSPPNGILIDSAFLQCSQTWPTDRHTDRPRYSMCSNSRVLCNAMNSCDVA